MTTPLEEYSTIELTQGQVAIVDSADFDNLSQWKWCSDSAQDPAFGLQQCGKCYFRKLKAIPRYLPAPLPDVACGGAGSV